jgi:tagaturonate reductase
MNLSRKNLSQLNGLLNAVPSAELFSLPEKILQFGTGVLLRALPDYFVDMANKQGIFNGRIVAVKSTGKGSTDPFTLQDGLYTICVRGTENGIPVQENIINASISRVLNANTEWKEILACASNPQLKLIFSNTTEVGIQLTGDDIHLSPPHSFPGKLLAFLYERYRYFNGSAESGMVIIPTELVSDNGLLLRQIVLELSRRHQLGDVFTHWLENKNTFCNSLVDRIVPGRPAAAEAAKIENELGYHDELLTVSEVFRLWAIEGDEKIKELLSFARADEGVQIVPDIRLFKELKLRLLNGTHSFNCGLAYLSGFHSTREAVCDNCFSQFTRQLMLHEIVPSIPYTTDHGIKEEFAHKVLERFCNPYIHHPWLSISVQYTSKMKMRNVPLIQKYYELFGSPPLRMATGFAGFLYFMKAVRKSNGSYFGLCQGQEYEIIDDAADYFYTLWHKFTPDNLVHEVLRNEPLWGADLSRLPEFENIVLAQLTKIMQQGILTTLQAIKAKKESM